MRRSVNLYNTTRKQFPTYKSSYLIGTIALALEDVRSKNSVAKRFANAAPIFRSVRAPVLRYLLGRSRLRRLWLL
ncbi:hypothetical protein [Laspinema olomoucense]|uniref:Uncharacterized protein n=1 Tax=Laspinema olomoucense D3b TaxID=2953688 RepID=A0ABT2N1C9_9CYAN|nr:MULTISPECIES: hypothetical protein [unclassified Laspinema]MCT7971981.1 hypothetical protein [Laspinema sp. D3d]MCT7976452.1 hypothetical protein [Laspinema sp. D3b]MCT7990028.1 hypothetical protein [Laspinema sp. D3a]